MSLGIHFVLHVDASWISCRLHFDFASMPLRFNFGFISSPLGCHCCFILISHRSHVEFSSISFRHPSTSLHVNINVSCIYRWFHSDLIRFHSDLVMSLRFHTSIPLWLHYDVTSIGFALTSHFGSEPTLIPHVDSTLNSSGVNISRMGWRVSISQIDWGGRRL